MKALQVYFKVPADVQGEEGRFVASCFLLTTPCGGATKHEALSALTEAVQAFLAQQCAGRTLDDVLRQSTRELLQHLMLVMPNTRARQQPDGQTKAQQQGGQRQLRFVHI